VGSSTGASSGQIALDVTVAGTLLSPQSARNATIEPASTVTGVTSIHTPPALAALGCPQALAQPSNAKSPTVPSSMRIDRIGAPFRTRRVMYHPATRIVPSPNQPIKDLWPA